MVAMDYFTLAGAWLFLQHTTFPGNGSNAENKFQIIPAHFEVEKSSFALTFYASKLRKVAGITNSLEIHESQKLLKSQ